MSRHTYTAVTTCNTHHQQSKITLGVSASLFGRNVEWVIQLWVRDRPTYTLNPYTAEPLLSVVCVCVGGGGSTKGVPDYLFSLHCLMMLYGKLYSLFSHNLPSISPPHHFLPLHLSFSCFLSLFYFYFPALITSFLPCVLTTSASHFILQTKRYHSLLQAYNCAGSFPVYCP